MICRKAEGLTLFQMIALIGETTGDPCGISYNGYNLVKRYQIWPSYYYFSPLSDLQDYSLQPIIVKLSQEGTEVCGHVDPLTGGIYCKYCFQTSWCCLNLVSNTFNKR